jgi:hypothetical protein
MAAILSRIVRLKLTAMGCGSLMDGPTSSIDSLNGELRLS